MAASDLINLSGLIDDAKCFALVRQHRWPEGACCPVCGSSAVIRDGHDDTQPCRQRYRCKTCSGRFDGLTGTVLAGHHQPLRVWVLCVNQRRYRTQGKCEYSIYYGADQRRDPSLTYTAWP